MKAVLLAAGRSTRTWPLTQDISKPLLPVLGMPILGYTVGGLKEVVDEWYVLTGFGADQVEEYLRTTFPETIFHFVTDVMQGTGSAVRLLAEQLKDETFLVLNGDDLYHPNDLKRLIASEQKNAVLVKEVKDPERFGVFVLQDGYPVSLVEKPQEPISNLANAGAYKFHGEIFDYTLTKSPRGEYEIIEYLNFLMAGQKKIDLLKIEGYWLPITYPWDILVAQRYFLSQADVSWRVDETAKIDPSVFLGKNVYVGKNSVIGEGVELEDVCIMDSVQVGAYAFLHGSVLAAGTVVEGDTIVTPQDGEHMLPIAQKDPVPMNPPFRGIFTAQNTQVAGFIDGPSFLTS